MDGVPAGELASRKRLLVQELNSYIAMKKERSGDMEARKELALTSRNSSPEKAYAGVQDVSGDEYHHCSVDALYQFLL